MRFYSVCLKVRVVACLALLCVCGCGERYTIGSRIDWNGNIESGVLFRGSDEYARKVAQFPVSFEDAREILAALERDEHDDDDTIVYVGAHDILVGDWYVFGELHKLGPSLWGTYVNGKTGKVEYRDTRGVVRERE